jgi:hypothetical protein
MINFFASLDIPTARLNFLSGVLPYWVFYDNEAAYIADQKLYTTILLKDMSTTTPNLVSLDVTTGKIVYQPSYSPNNIIWGLRYGNF